MNNKWILYPLRLVIAVAFLLLLVTMMGCTMKPSNAQDPIRADDPGSKDEPNPEYSKWSTVRYDSHLYTVRDPQNSYGAAVVHSPNCPCLTNKVMEAR